MRTRELFCDNWKFHKGDIAVTRPKDKGPIYIRAKTERYRMGPAAVLYNDTPDCFQTNKEFVSERWTYVRLPHDYVIEEIPTPEENNRLAAEKASLRVLALAVR